MEASVAFLLDAKNNASADFIELMWGEVDAPVELEEVEPDFHQAFKALEFLDYPPVYHRDSNTRLLGFFDVINCLDISETISDLVLPYLDASANKILVVISGEAYVWVEVDAQGMRYAKVKHLLKEIKTSDMFDQLRYVARGLLWGE